MTDTRRANTDAHWPKARPDIFDVWACVVWDAGPEDAKVAADLLQAAVWSVPAHPAGTPEERVFLHTLFESVVEADEDMPAPSVRAVKTATELLVNYLPKDGTRSLSDAVKLINETLARVQKMP